MPKCAAILTAHAQVPVDRLSQKLKNNLVEVGGFMENHLDDTKSLDKFGLGSLVQIDFVSLLGHAFPGQQGVNHHALWECETLGAINDLI